MRAVFLTLLLASGVCAAEADLILHNGKIVTVDNAFSIQQAVAVGDGRIVAVGKSADILRGWRGAKTEVVDLRGRTVLPGLFDSHVHPLGAALSEFREKLPAFDSFASVQDYIRKKAAVTPKGKWIVVPRTFPTRLKELRMPTREVLDVVTTHPVMFDASYVVIVNSLGLKVSGITRDTPNPPRGEIVHGPDGEPNGILKNAEGLLKGLDRAVQFTEAERLRALDEMLHRYVEAGLTSIGDGGVRPEDIALYRKLKASGKLPLRVTMTWWHDAARPLDNLREEIQSTRETTGDGDDWLRFGAWKLNVDGGMTIGTAYQRAAYGEFGGRLYGKTDPKDRGQLFESPEKLLEIMKSVREKKWQMTSHCQGGGAIDGFLDAMEALDKVQPIAATRSHLIHASFQSPESIARMKKMGLLADVQAAWLYHDSAALEKVFGHAGMRYFFPLRSYLNAGITVAGGSDHMIGHDKNGATNPYNPFLGLWTSVTRVNSSGDVLYPEERVTRAEALRMYTINAAYRQFAEKTRGSIEVGKLGDMVVIDRDYLECPESEIRSIEPLMVVINGKFAVKKGN
jgi:predicted amidohydrolase YtcJ